MDGPTPAREIVEHYSDEIDEAARLVGGINELELVRVREIVRRHLVATSLRIVDVGGGTGVHARWLAADGHTVRVVDPVPRHVDAVRGLRAGGLDVDAELGDARALPADDDSFDAALVFGPLYHLTERDDRVRALAKAARVVAPDGPVFVAAISRYASLLDGLAREFLFDREFVAIVERDLRDGQHRNPNRRPHWFTTAYFHHADELRDELVAARLQPVEILGVEGPAAWLPHVAPRWDDTAGRDVLLFAARAAQSEPALSPHMLAVARVPG